MKLKINRIFFFVFLFVFVLCSSCIAEQSVNNNISSLDSTITINLNDIQLKEAIYYLSPAESTSELNATQISLFWTFTANGLPEEEIGNAFHQRHIQILCNINNTNRLEIQETYWNVFKKIDKNTYLLKSDLYFSATEEISNFHIESVKIYAGNEKKEFSNITDIHVSMTHYTEPKYAFCAQSPMFLEDNLDLYYCLIAIPEEHDEKQLKFNITSNNEALTINITEWNYNESLTDDFKEMYSSHKTKQDMQHFKIYELKAQFKIKDNSCAVVQPIISVEYNQNKYQCLTEILMIEP